MLNAAPDTILINGKVLTVNSAFDVAEAVAVAGERILAVGTSAEVRALADGATEVVDLEGKTVIPGLIENHVHPVSASQSELDEPIPSVRTVDELLKWVASQAGAKPTGTWIVHPKMFPTRLKELRQPTLAELDAVSPDHPVFLNGSYGGMVNTKAFEVNGIGEDAGHAGLLRDPETGKRTGIIQRSAFALFDRDVERPLTHDEKMDALEALLRRYNQIGITGVTDGMLRGDGPRLYQDLRAAGRLTVRINGNVTAPPFESEEQFRSALDAKGPYTNFGDEWFRLGALKWSLDGGILTGTAYLREPWGANAQEIFGISDPEFRGVVNFDQKTLNRAFSTANEYGWKLTAHCTGGGGVDMMLTAYEAADKVDPVAPKRSSIIHGNFFTPESMTRCARLGIIADAQPAWFYMDADAMGHILGPERIKTFLPFRSLFEAGVVVCGGSDHMVKLDSVESINPYNPFLGMWTSITRKTQWGTTVVEEEGITREQALRMYTINNAYGQFDETIKGSLEPGKLADLAVLTDDYMDCPVDAIREMEVEMTMVGGETVYERR